MGKCRYRPRHPQSGGYELPVLSGPCNPGSSPSPRTAHSHNHVCTRPHTHSLPVRSRPRPPLAWRSRVAGLAPTRAWQGLPVPWPFTLQDLLLMGSLLAPWLSSSTLSSQDNLLSLTLLWKRTSPIEYWGRRGSTPTAGGSGPGPRPRHQASSLTHDDPSGPGLQDPPVYESVSQHHFSAPVGGVAAWFPGQQAKRGANTSGLFSHPGRGPDCLWGLGPSLQACVGPARSPRAQIGGLVFLCRRRRGRRWEGPSVGTRPELPPPVTNDPPVPTALASSSAK